MHDLNTRIEEDHNELRAMLHSLEAAFSALPSAAAFMDWRLDRMARLRDFQSLLLKHFDLEEQGGYTDDLKQAAPALVPQIEHLLEDHRKIESDLGHILDSFKQVRDAESPLLERLQRRIQDLLDFIRAHEAEENGVIQEAFYRDYGVGD